MNIAPYGSMLIYWDKIKNLEGYILNSFYHWEIKEWASGFLE